jgi:hypothetical protein
MKEPTDCNSNSNIPELEVPEFKPSIPKYMVDNIKDDTLKFLVEQTSIIKQQNKWQSEHLAQVFDYTRKINGKVIELEKYRQAHELNDIIQDELMKKGKKNRKYTVPAIIGFGVFLYPLYISLFLEAGPFNMVDFVIKFIP